MCYKTGQVYLLLTTLAFLIALVLTLWQHEYLVRRQARAVRSHLDAVPSRFAAVVTLQAHRKAADYTLARLHLGRILRGWQAILVLAWTLGGCLELLDRTMHRLGGRGIVTGVAVMLAFFVLNHLLELPFEIWQRFGIEARFGFNRMRPALFVGDLLRRGLLLLLLGAPLLALVLAVITHGGRLWWLYAWLVWSLFLMFMMRAYPVWIAPLFNRFKPLEEGTLKARIESLLDRCGFSSGGIFVMDASKRSRHGNAFLTGWGRTRRIVLFDTLLATLRDEEVEAVLAHELGHDRCGHVGKQMGISVLLSLAAFLLLDGCMRQSWFYAGLGVEHPSPQAALILFVLLMHVVLFWAAPLQNALSRRYEFEADAFAARLVGAEALIAALVKMYRDNAVTLTPDPLYSAWYESHPPAPIRIARLESIT